MADENRERPVTTDEEIDRTGRDGQVAPKPGFDASASKLEQRTGLDDDDAPGDGVDSADFPGAGAP